MNEKLIRRAAIKYRNWMVGIADTPPYDLSIPIGRKIKSAIAKIQDMEKWVDRFIDGSKQRFQLDPWDEDKVYHGIHNRSVYSKIASDLIPRLSENLMVQIKDAILMVKRMGEKSTITPLTIRDAIKEIRIVDNEWNDVKFRDNILSVTIKNVSLEDEDATVELGSFIISINLTNPLNSLSIESIDEIASEGGYYHPHVRGKRLCLGHGQKLSNQEIINKAVAQGRLEDYFDIIEAILRTYNGGSPHEELSQWYNPTHEDEFLCNGCGEWQSDENSSYCEGCSTYYCYSCTEDGGCCECGDWRCKSCTNQCNVCGESLCPNCSNLCYACETYNCSTCTGNCVDCKETHCTNCTDPCNGGCYNYICEDCQNICSHCKKNYCSDCIQDGDCPGCNIKGICADCGSHLCEHCGVKMCESCLDDHKCLLAGISN